MAKRASEQSSGGGRWGSHLGIIRTVLFILLFALAGIAQESPQPESSDTTWAALHTHGYAFFENGRYADALADFNASLPLAASPEQRAMTLSDIGYTLTELGRTADALTRLEQARPLWMSIDTAGHRALQVTITIGILHRILGHFRESEQILRSAVGSARDSSDHSDALVALGDLLNEQARFIESRPIFEEALRLSPGRDRSRASALIGLGDAESNSRQIQPGIGHLREAQAISREIKAPELEALSLRDLGNTYAGMGDFASAQTMLRRALPIFEAVPAMRIQRAGTLVSLGVVYGAEKKLGLAEHALTQALEVYGDASTNPRSALALENLAMIRVQQKRFDEAADLANRAYAYLKSAFGENSAPVADVLGALAFAEKEAGNLTQSEHDYSRALAILRDNGALESTSAANLSSAYASVLRRLHRRREANAVEHEAKTTHPSAQQH